MYSNRESYNYPYGIVDCYCKSTKLQVIVGDVQTY